MDKTDIRIECIKILYEIELRQEDCLIVLREKDNLDQEVAELITDIYPKLLDIKAIITANLKNYTINRLNLVDLAIIEFATYELKYTNTPKAVVINEALNISRTYTQTDNENTVRFNNKLLDNIAKSLGD